MDELKKEGKKRRNSTDVERQLLLQLVESEKGIIEQRENSSKVWRKKETAWETILKRYNSQKNVSKLDMKAIKKMWDNMKAKAKKDVSKEKKARHRTGGGVMEEEDKADDSAHTVASICSDVIEPLDNDVDDDAGYHVPVNPHGVKPTAAVGSSQSPSDASFFDEAHRPSTSAELPNSQYLETSSDPATPSIQPILIRESDSAAKVTKRKSTPDEPPCSASAYQSVMNMQQIEHELQVKRYKQQIFMQETEEERRIAEHEQRMKVWKLQETLLTDLIKRQRNSRDGDDSSTISISRVLAQLE
ncbi:myb/SANT-like DNA-binding domain-containing protein 3 [Lineus longissimus]|uniref:myb/SANT-like DNA-binding domain-containing protein 3 n=1 Tax=Lineus longissimus TaxID=88925 RepID=UPI00315CB2F0